MTYLKNKHDYKYINFIKINNIKVQDINTYDKNG